MRLVAIVLGLSIAVAQDPQKPPTFRAGVNLVRVDAYPSRDGKIVEGLTASDFELLEDGVRQSIESFQYVPFEQHNPVGERRDPNSQREGFALAADPSRRVFVIYLDNLHVDFTHSHRVRAPLVTFLNQVLGPKDLFGVLTTRQRPQDLMLGQQTQFIEEQLTRHWDWGTGARVTEDEEDLMLAACAGGEQRIVGELVARRRLDEVFSDLEGLTALLADIREERKNILLVSNGWPLPGRSNRLLQQSQPRMPGVGVSDVGKLTTGARRRGEVDPRWCEAELQRLANIDFQARLREFLQVARRSNVTFYSLKPAGLVASASLSALDRDTASTDSLLTLSHNTDGIAVVNSNDLTAGARRIAEDLSGAYLLGYYPTNTKWDGGIRRITVRLTGTKENVRARREYRAPTAEEMASVRAASLVRAAPPPVSPVDDALAELKRVRPAAVIHTRGAILRDRLELTVELTSPEVEAGRWKEGGRIEIILSTADGDILRTVSAKLERGERAAVVQLPLAGAPGPFNASMRLRGEDGAAAQDALAIARPVAAFGQPSMFRLTTPSSPRPAASPQFRRTERIQIRWPVAETLPPPAARLLGRDGVAIPLTVSQREIIEDGVRLFVVDLNLAALTAGEYVIEARAPGSAESAHLAFRVSR